MLNLRQVNRSADTNPSDMQHFSRFSVSFRVPSDFLGNIGESMVNDDATYNDDLAGALSHDHISFDDNCPDVVVTNTGKSTPSNAAGSSMTALSSDSSTSDGARQSVGERMESHQDASKAVATALFSAV